MNELLANPMATLFAFILLISLSICLVAGVVDLIRRRLNAYRAAPRKE